MKINFVHPLFALLIIGITGWNRAVTSPDKISAADDSVITMKGSESELKLLVFFSEGLKKKNRALQ